MIKPQNYPRIEDESNRYDGYLDDSKLVQHTSKADRDKFQKIIETSIKSASKKSSRAILEIPDDVGEDTVNTMLLKSGEELFKYFVKYCGDPAASAFDCIGRSYIDIAKEQFHNRTLQKERMNSGWRYQFISKDMASQSGRFSSVSDIGAAEADFNVTIKQTDERKPAVSIYVSIKNRINTMGGQDWPKAIRAIEEMAKADKNRVGAYLCVFGIAMEHGTRVMKNEQRTGRPYSVNTEVWLSDFFWPFFTNYSYLEVISEVVSTLERIGKQHLKTETIGEVPEILIKSFGKVCEKYQLLDTDSKFYDAQRLAELFVMGIRDYGALYGI